MDVTQERAPFGAYGKIPALGDFFQLSLPRSFVAPWDDWLQETLTRARSALGPRWQDCYLTAPVWRFTLSAGLAGPASVVGVLMPSVDTVGRLFPLTLAAPLGGAAPAALHGAWEGFDRLETLARAMLEEGATKAALAHGLAGVTLPGPVRAPLRSAATGMRLVRAPGVTSGLCALGAAEFCAGFAAPSVWSTATEDGARHLAADGLPGPQAAAALFDPAAELWPGTPAGAAP